MLLTALDFALYFAKAATVVAIGLCGYRLLRGPTAQDRVLALEMLWFCCMLLALLLGMRFASDVYFELAMLIALTGFVSTVALSKFLMRGEIIE